MGIFSRLSTWLDRVSQDATMTSETQTTSSSSPMPSTQDSPGNTESGYDWVMPEFEGHKICDLVDVIKALKREENIDEALRLALGSMNAMITEAQRNPANAMEFYVVQVAIIQRKQKAYKEELRTIDSWLGLQIPVLRSDLHTDLLKRRAKAQELLAKQEGRDPSPYHAEWKRLLEQQKAEKAADKQQQPTAPASGRSADRKRSTSVQKRKSVRSRAPKWIAPAEILQQSTFVAVDFETANTNPASACQVALVKVSHGLVIGRYVSLLKPPPELDNFEFTYLHGISRRRVRKAPSWDVVAPVISDFIGDLPVYAHNAPFDAGVWRELDQRFGTATLPDEFYCSYRTAKRLVPGLVNYKLPTVVEHLVPSYRLKHHQADSDAEACGLIIVALQSRT